MTTPSATPHLPLNLHEYEAAARPLLPPAIFDFAAGGSGDLVTLRSCTESFARWRLLPRVLRGVREVSTATSVLGQEVALPVLVAPMGLHRLFHDEGELAAARAAKTAGTIFALSTTASLVLEEVAAAAGPWWFQLYAFRDRERTREFVARAAAAGAAALVVTVDTPLPGRREADLRNRFALPADVSFANLPEYAPAIDDASGSMVTRTVNAIFDPALTWTDLDWLASLSSLPVALKGVLHPDDAVRALDHGARAVIVSNHGGRQLDSAIAALDALPAVVAAVAGRAEILVDGGVRRGGHVLIALALGARAVLVGRPLAWGLAVDGEAGVRHVLELLRTELERDLLLCGLASPAEVDHSLLVPAGETMA
jgi:4-hydroxymandelate oxidase